eukprot:jgi/Chlat1/9083/Chrsp96S08368
MKGDGSEEDLEEPPRRRHVPCVVAAAVTVLLLVAVAAIAAGEDTRRNLLFAAGEGDEAASHTWHYSNRRLLQESAGRDTDSALASCTGSVYTFRSGWVGEGAAQSSSKKKRRRKRRKSRDDDRGESDAKDLECVLSSDCDDVANGASAPDLYRVEFRAEGGREIYSPALVSFNDNNNSNNSVSLYSVPVSCAFETEYSVKIFLEMEASERAREIPREVWVTDIPSEILYHWRPEDYRGDAYRTSMPLQREVLVGHGRTRCTPCPDGGDVGGLVRKGDTAWPVLGSWIELDKEQEWYLDWGPKDIPKSGVGPKEMQAFDTLPAMKRMAWRRHGRAPAPQLYRRELLAKAAACAGTGPKRIHIVGDSLMMLLAETIVLAAGQMKTVDWGIQHDWVHGALPMYKPWAMQLTNPNIALSQTFFCPISFDRYANTTQVWREMGLFEIDTPDVFVMSAGLWDAQSREPEEYAKYAPLLLRAIQEFFRDKPTKLMWVYATPVWAGKNGGDNTWRINDHIIDEHVIMSNLLQHEEFRERWYAIDAFSIVNAMRHYAKDNRHYNPLVYVDVANELLYVAYEDGVHCALSSEHSNVQSS